MKKIIEGIGRRLRLERERLGLTQAQLGQACGLTPLTQFKYEAEQTSPTTTYLLRAQEHGVEPTAVLFGHEAAEESPIDWELIRSCVNDVGVYCSMVWQDCPEQYRWAMVQKLYEKCRGSATVRRSSQEERIKQIERSLGMA